MIRFTCPGCGATYSVDDSKGGKTGRCPKCQVQFQIPMPEGGVAPPPAPSAPSAPSAPVDPNAPVEINPCPGCQARLSVAASDLGVDVECPYCKTIYKATRAGGAPPLPPPPPPKRSNLEDAGGRNRRDVDDEDRPSRRRARRDEDEDEDDRPSRRRRDDDEEDDRPSRRRRDEDEEDEDRPSRRRRSRRDEDDEEDEDRPRRRRRRRRYGGGGEPHRGVTILLLGIFGFLCCVFLAIAAVIMGMQDLGKMNSGEMDPSGKGLTITGMVFGFLGIGVAILNIIMAVTGR